VTTILTGWLAFAAAEIALSGAMIGKPSLAGAAAELALLGLIGLLHGAAVRCWSWLGGPFAPAAWSLVIVALARTIAHDGVRHRLHLGLFDLVVVAIVAGLAGRALERRAPSWGPALATLAGPIGAIAANALHGYYLGGAHHVLRSLDEAIPWLVPTAVIAALLALIWQRQAPVWSLAAGLVVAGTIAVHLPTAALRPRALDGVPRSVLVVTIDTLRRDDALNMASYARLARRGVAFDDALSTSSWTLPALASLMTGTDVSEHGARRLTHGWPSVGAIDDDLATLAERLDDAGYATGAVVANSFTSRASGLARGFDHWRNLMRTPHSRWLGLGLIGRRPDLGPRDASTHDGAIVVDEGLHWLRRRGRPFFLWLHLSDPHLPYHHATLTPESALFDALGGDGARDLDVATLRQGQLWHEPAVAAEMRRLYRDEVAHADLQVMRLLDELDALDLLEQTVVVFSSDHGEEFLDHDGWEHGHTFHEELVAIPLVIVAPDLAPGQRADPVSLSDVAPTVAALLGQPWPSGSGHDALASDPIPADRARHLGGHLYRRPGAAVVVGDLKLVREGDGPARLYRRSSGETRNIAGDDPALAEHLESLVHDHLARTGERTDVDDDALRALGYVR